MGQRLLNRKIALILLGVASILVFGAALLSFSFVSGLLKEERASDLSLVNKYLDTTNLGTIHFLNDLAGIDPRIDGLPAAMLISHSATPYALVSSMADEGALKLAETWGLSQDPDFFGWGAQSKAGVSKSRLHLQYVNTMLLGHYTGRDSSAAIEIIIPWPATFYADESINVVVESTAIETKFMFELEGSGAFWIEPQPPPSDGFPIQFRLINLPPADVSIGRNLVHPSASTFSLQTRDLHSFAISELDGDTGIEASIVRGGVRGRIGEVSKMAQDVLLDLSEQSEITGLFPEFLKQGCPGRQSAWVDVDNDLDLDLYIVCGRASGAGADFANQLYTLNRGKFVEKAKQFGLNLNISGSFRFIDWDGDLDPDLWMASSEGNLLYFENVEGHFLEKYRRESIGRGWGSRSPQLLLRDIGKDGDPDLFLVHNAGNFLVQNDDNVSILAASDAGLPAKALVGAWADINLDGYEDLLTVTKGIFFGGPGMQYTLEPSTLDGEKFIRDARLVSFGGVNGRQFLMAAYRCLPGRLCSYRQKSLIKWRHYFPLSFEKLTEKGLIEPKVWLLKSLKRSVVENPLTREVSFSVQGPVMNPFSIGARLDLSWLGHAESHWVGETESSLFSQSNFSIYASIPFDEAFSGIAIWQDGCRQRFSGSALVNKITVARPAECN